MNAEQVLSMIGPVPLALTTNLHINFLRAPKLGDVVAHATVTYSIPPAR